MANPQTENGHTQIANELLEALIKVNLSNYEFRVFMAILRKTYGYKKKKDWLSLSQLGNITGIGIPHICRTIKKLVAKNMILKNGKIAGIQKDYDLWKLPKQAVPKQAVPKQVINDQKVTQTGNKKLPKQADTKEIKENIYIYNIFDYWNKKEIITHKKLDQATANKINAKLKDYSIDEIKDAIHIYSEILKDNETYWFNYKWTLKDFLQRGFEKFKDKDIAHENYLRKDKK